MTTTKTTPSEPTGMQPIKLDPLEVQKLNVELWESNLRKDRQIKYLELSIYQMTKDFQTKMDTIAELKHLHHKLLDYANIAEPDNTVVATYFTDEEIDHLLLLVEEDILQNA